MGLHRGGDVCVLEGECGVSEWKHAVVKKHLPLQSSAASVALR